MLTIFILIYIYNSLSINNYFSIKANNKLFYIIPNDKGGIQIENQDKKGLHLSYVDEAQIDIDNNLNLNFSIQLFANSDYVIVKNKKNQFLKKEDNFFDKNDLHILVLETTVGNNYLLLYKNFDKRASALNYCNKFLHFLNKCLVVNVKNIN